MILGDSRTYAGLDVLAAERAAGGTLRLINAAIPGTTPRCWTVFARTLDPNASRFRAVVVPVDTYADDDSAVGSSDANDREFDLRYIVFRTGIRQALQIAGDFHTPDGKARALLDLWARGPLLRDDLADLVSNPAARFAALGLPLPDLTVPHFRAQTLVGIRVDYRHHQVVLPPGDYVDRAEMDRQLFHDTRPDPAYGAYRREWFGELVARYRAHGVPVVFVRIPTRPLHRAAPQEPEGSLPALAREGAVLLPQAPYVALERPDLFADGAHLNTRGAEHFSALLGSDLARVLR